MFTGTALGPRSEHRVSGWDMLLPLALALAPVFVLMLGVTAAGLELRGLVQRRPPSAEWFNFGCAVCWGLGCLVWTAFTRFASPFWHMNDEGLELANQIGVAMAGVWLIVALARMVSLS